MRKIFQSLCAVLLVLPSLSLALWQVSNPNPVQRVISPRLGKTDYPLYYYTNKTFTILPQEGSLISNVQRVANSNGWKVVWRAQKNYWVTNNVNKIEGPTFIVTMDRLLNYYPLRARYNKRLHTMTVYPATTAQHTPHKYGNLAHAK